MTAYCDPEIADCLSIAGRGLVQMEKDMDRVKRADLSDDADTPSVHGIQTAGLVLTSRSSAEPVAIVRMEDVWAETNLLQEREEIKVVQVIMDALVRPERYRVDESGNLIKQNDKG